VKLLLESKADPDLKDQSSRTPLSWATANGHKGIVKLLCGDEKEEEAEEEEEEEEHIRRAITLGVHIHGS
jgi:ankyrin repeat protein